MKPGLYDSISSEQYHADQFGDAPTLSASVLKVLLNQSAEHARERNPRLATVEYDWPATDAQKVGSVAHAILLGRGERYWIPNPSDYLTKDGKPSKTMGSAEAQAALADARANGLIDISEKRYGEALAVTAKMSEVIAADYPNWKDGKSEVVLIFEYRLNDGSMILCRAMMDRLVERCVCVEDSVPHVHVFDQKNTGKQASDEWLDKTIALDGWDIQASFYLIGAEKSFRLDPPESLRGDVRFTFVVGELFPPFAVRFVTLPDSWLNDARQDVDRGANLWGAALRSGVWPGRSKLYVAQRPAWVEARRFMAALATETEEDV